MPWYLSSFPVEVVALILTWVQVNDIGRLWFIGDQKLRQRLKNGSVTNFCLRHALQWPKLASEFQLTSLEVTAPSTYDAPSVYLPNVELQTLWPALRTLTIYFPNALSQLLLLPPGVNLATFFPNLLELRFGEQHIPQFSRKEFLANLPASVTRLELPFNIGFDLEAVKAMPCSLIDLTIALYPFKSGTEAEFRNLPNFSNLAMLSVDVLRDINRAALTPPSVVELYWGQPSSTLSANMVASELLDLKNAAPNQPPDPTDPLIELSSSDFLLLPPRLTMLYLPYDVNPGIEGLKALPPTITHLSWYKLANISYDQAQLLAALPPKISLLITGTFTITQLQTLSLLPRSLTRFKNLCLNIPGDALPVPPADGQDPPGDSLSPTSAPSGSDRVYADFPKDLQTLRVDVLTDRIIPFLPKSLIELQTDRDFLLSETGLRNLCSRLSNLTELGLGVYRLDARLLLHLPPQLRNFSMRALHLDHVNEISQQWDRVWPKQQLQRLSIRVGENPVVLPEAFFYTFPETLEWLSLSLTLTDDSYFPPNLGYLPRKVKEHSLSLNPSASRTFPDSFFQNCPPLLQTLSFSGSYFTASHEAFTLLPKCFCKFEIYWARPRPPALVNFALPSFPATLPAEYLDKYPKFLFFQSWGSTTRGPVSPLAYHQLDDLIDACPNVSFDGHPAGADRPYGTPRR